jgi:chemotaxis response regulator CheB
MSKNGQPIRIVVADGSAFIRNRLSMMLMKSSNRQVVGTIMNGLDAIEQAKRTQPDVMMLDIERPSMNGFGSIRLIEYGIV